MRPHWKIIWRLIYMIFVLFVDDEIINLFALETNRYAQQKLNKSQLIPCSWIHKSTINPEEVKKFLGLLLWMGFVKLCKLITDRKVHYIIFNYCVPLYHETNLNYFYWVTFILPIIYLLPMMSLEKYFHFSINFKESFRKYSLNVLLMKHWFHRMKDSSSNNVYQIKHQNKG